MEPRRVPTLRIRSLNDESPKDAGDFVLYWMLATRRGHYNFGLQRASVVAHTLAKPLVILEALKCDYPWASDRIHRFVMQGMAENARRFSEANVEYYPWVEREPGEGRGLLHALAERACFVVTDDYPAFFLPRLLSSAAKQVPVRFEAVDSNGLFPLRAAKKTFARAHDFRRFLHKQLPAHLAASERPTPDPLAGLDLPRTKLPGAVTDRWPAAKVAELEDPSMLLTLPIDHSVGSALANGGAAAAERRWEAFAERGLKLYAEGRNHPDDDLSSGLSPWLHFGHVSTHEIFDRLTESTGWSPDSLGPATGSREGWWGLDPGREGFLDELVTWRELGFSMAHREADYTEFGSLPEWARKTLDDHRSDPRPYTYDRQRFEAADTHDEVWNAAQRQLRHEGRMHNYLRMLWGKKILHWSSGPEEALDTMVELNNKYALDGRDPNSYSGIFWVLGRYDRAWGPEREVFGKVRYMSSDSTVKKLRIKRYLAKWAG